MSDLRYDSSSRIYYETDVTTPAGLCVNDAYDLYLYQERSNNPRRGVLVVRSVLQFQFEDGEDQNGNDLEWTDTERRNFANNFISACHGVWNNKWRITTTSQVPMVRDIGVQFELSILIDGWHSSDHWELSVVKTDGMPISSVDFRWGNCNFDSNDFQQKNFCHQHDPSGSNCLTPSQQRGAVHELGHMLGLKDEYPSAPASLKAAHWIGDHTSVMHSGESVRKRHYAPFADWISRQYATAAHLSGQDIEFKVDGTVDLSNAHLS